MTQNMRRDIVQNVFSGADGLRHYLDPLNGQFTPLVELPPDMNPYAGYNIRIHAKLLNALPLGNVKSIPAFHMLNQSGYTGKKKIIESSSGNTVASMGLLASYFGYDETYALVSHEVTKGKLDLLRLYGVHPIINREPICPSESDETSGIKKARKQGQRLAWFNPDQYGNPLNINAHYQVTGPQIWQQIEHKINYFCASMGTTGTIMGTSQFLKEQNPDIQTVGVVRSPNNPIPGPRTRNLLNEVSFGWRESCDDIVEVGTREAYELSLKMIRKGLLVGPSSGMALGGVLKYIAGQPSLLENTDEKNFVFICCDGASPYMDEYFKNLPEDHFPFIANKNLLQDTSQDQINMTNPENMIMTAKQLSEVIQDGDGNLTLIDLRQHKKFMEYHIPGSVNIPESDFISSISVFSKLYGRKKTVLICEQGVVSGLLAPYANAKGFNAASLEGGLIEWSNQNLPRIKHSVCTL